MQKSVLIVAGTRPEAVKLAPLMLEMRRRDGFQPLFCATAQHRELLDDVLHFFDITPDFDLDLMRDGQTPAQVAAAVLEKLPKVLSKCRPSMVIVQGDTTTACAGALCAFYHHVPVGHVEAGLRTGNMDAPFPEEGNRRVISALASLHFAPTEKARANLLREGIADARIQVTGNTVIDALLHASAIAEAPAPFAGKKVILVTGHRRESFGGGLASVCRALKRIAMAHPEIVVMYPMHPNPAVLGTVRKALEGVGNVITSGPLPYGEMVGLLKACCFVITDSGGIQEEAPALGKPVLVTRDTTERPEGVEAGCAKLVGTNEDAIVAEAERLICEQGYYKSMARVRNPYGDGKASVRIADRIEREILG